METNKEITAIDFLNQKAKDIAYIDFYNFLVESDTTRKFALILKWV